MSHAGHILIVEDEPQIAQLLKDYLEQAAFETSWLDRGDTVCPFLETTEVDLVLLDLMLPGQDGISVARQIRSGSELPIIMVTARVEEVDRLLGLELGADDYICKPFSPREVVARVKTVLKRLRPAATPSPALTIDESQLLATWGERLEIPVVSQHTGADSASVIFDAYQSAQARGVDVLLADTAGRLHTKDNLMDELAKVKRVLGKLDADAPHETLLVIDATTGQNAINQATTFNDAVGLDSLVLTKLDGTAKGGVVFALAERLGLPLRFIGVGEAVEDLQPFAAEAFIDALFDNAGAEESALPP